jgi:hypothetical protein
MGSVLALWSVRQVIRLYACWLPGLFLVNDFTVPGVATSRGDGKNPNPRRLTCLFAPSKRPRFPDAVLLRSAIQNT